MTSHRLAAAVFGYQLLFLGCGLLQGQVTFYTNRQAWQTAVTAQTSGAKTTTIGFEGLAPAGGATGYSTAAGLTSNGVNFVGLSGNNVYGLAVADSQFYNPRLYDRGTGASLQSSNSCCSMALNQFNITLPTGTFAAGADLWTVQLDGLSGNGTDTVKLTLATGASTTVVTLPYPGVAFLGFVSSSPVTSMSYYQSTPGEIPELDNFSFAVPGAVVAPAPAIGGVVSATGIPGSVQPGIEAASWAAIYGTNLAPAIQDWTGLIVNGQLPTKIGTVTVTIGGKPAFIYYVSPSQIDVQVPDIGPGPVQVVVTTNGVASAPYTAQNQTLAPAFFQWGPTRYAVATRYPDYAYLSGPAAGSVFSIARAGDVVVLWCTGFGPVQPTQAAGSVVVGAPATVNPVTVIVGGVSVPVLGAAMSPGLAGVYQVAVQLPTNLPSGDLLVKATVGGQATPDNVYLYIGGQ